LLLQRESVDPDQALKHALVPIASYEAAQSCRLDNLAAIRGCQGLEKNMRRAQNPFGCFASAARDTEKDGVKFADIAALAASIAAKGMLQSPVVEPR